MDTPLTARRFIAYLAGIVLFGVLVVYPISSGPAYFYLEQHYTTERYRFFDAFYSPAFAIADQQQTLSRAMAIYIRFWGTMALRDSPAPPPPTR